MPARPVTFYLVLPYSVDFKAPRELWNPLSKSTKTVLSKCSLIWNKGPVNIWNLSKAKKITCTSDLLIYIFPNFFTLKHDGNYEYSWYWSDMIYDQASCPLSPPQVWVVFDTCWLYNRQKTWLLPAHQKHVLDIFDNHDTSWEKVSSRMAITSKPWALQVKRC